MKAVILVLIFSFGVQALADQAPVQVPKSIEQLTHIKRRGHEARLIDRQLLMKRRFC